MKIVIVTCYHDPNYVRAITLRKAFKKVPGVKLTVLKNRRRGLMRYPEILWRLWRTKRSVRPDRIVLTFRGQELLLPTLLIAGKTPVWFDEYIVPIAYAKHEKHSFSLRTKVFHLLAKLGTPLYNQLLRRCEVILADTSAHAELGARSARCNLSRYLALPVGTDEKLFAPGRLASSTETFDVFFYGTIQPLHGVSVILRAATKLKDTPQIRFILIGPSKVFRHAVKKAQKQGANIVYRRWIPFADIPEQMRSSGVVLGGPLGVTRQAQHVITTKTYQALACGVPVIVGDSQVTASYFLHKHNALIVPQGDAEALAKLCLWTSQHQDALAEVGARGRQLFEKEFSTNAIARLIEARLQRVSTK